MNTIIIQNRNPSWDIRFVCQFSSLKLVQAVCKHLTLGCISVLVLSVNKGVLSSRQSICLLSADWNCFAHSGCAMSQDFPVGDKSVSTLWSCVNSFQATDVSLAQSEVSYWICIRRCFSWVESDKFNFPGRLWHILSNLRLGGTYSESAWHYYSYLV